jgi:hypothetical protein
MVCGVEVVETRIADRCKRRARELGESELEQRKECCS